MRSFLISLWVLLVFTCPIYAEPIRGASYIGMCNPRFPCTRALAVRPEAIGYLADAFGHRCSCVEKALTLSELKYVRVHISNGTCFPERGRRCERMDVFHRESQKTAAQKILSNDKTIQRRFQRSLNRSVRLLEGFRGTVRYSPMLESPLPNAVRRRLLKQVERKVGKENTVDSVLSQKCLRGYICERHGDRPRFRRGEQGQGCITDLDGVTMFEGDMEAFQKASEPCEAAFYWTFGFNLLDYGYQGRFIPPYKRTAKIKKWELEGLNILLHGEE